MTQLTMTEQRRPRRSGGARRTTAGLLSTAVLALAAACGSDGGAGDAEAAAAGDASEPTTLNIGAVPATSAVLLWTAAEQGFFEDQGLDVVLQPANGGPATVPALQSGAIDVGQSGILNAVQAQAAGLDIPCFLGNARMSPEGSFLPLVASEQSGVESAADLSGKSIAVNALGSAQELLATAYLEAEGVDVDSVKFVAVEIPAAAAAVTSGQVDAAIMTAPFSNIALAQGAVLIEAHPEAAIEDDLSFACYIATRDWLEENPEVVERFTTALDDAQAYIEENPAYQLEVVAKNLKTEAALVDGGMPLISPDLSTDDVQHWIDLGLEYGILDGEVDAEAVVYQ